MIGVAPVDKRGDTYDLPQCGNYKMGKSRNAIGLTHYQQLAKAFFISSSHVTCHAHYEKIPFEKKGTTTRQQVAEKIYFQVIR
jgi:hypothetical protein